MTGRPAATSRSSDARTPEPVRGPGIRGWLWRGGPRTLLCLPAAGSSALSFRPLAQAFGGSATVLAWEVDRDAPDRRHSVPDLARRVAAASASWLAAPTLVLGHSFGGYVGYEVAHLVARAAQDQEPGRAGAPDPVRLVLVGCAAPTRPSTALSWADDATLERTLTEAGAIPPELRRFPALVQRALPHIRDDLQCAAEYLDTYPWLPRLLAVPTLAIVGERDTLVDPASQTDWPRLCRPASVEVLPGDHYLPQHGARIVASRLLAWWSDENVARPA